MLFKPEPARKVESSTEQLASKVRSTLRQAGLRPTRQRMALGQLLFLDQPRHVTPDSLYEESRLAGETLSVATVYNMLNQFAEAGLIRKISLKGERTYFDTDTGDHTHFYIAAEDRLIHIPSESISVGPLPAPPAGYTIRKVDIMIQLERNHNEH